MAKLYQALRDTQDDKKELPLQARDGGFIKKGFSPEFDAVCDMRDEGATYMRELESKYVQLTGVDHLRIRYNNVIGYYIEVPSKGAAQLASDANFIHRQTLVNATRFVTVELTELESEIRGATDKALAIELELYNIHCHSNVMYYRQRIFYLLIEHRQ